MDYQAKFRGAVSRFMDDTTVLAHDGQISVKELFERWHHWCKEHNRFPGNLIAFGKELAARGEERKHTRTRTCRDRQEVARGIGVMRQNKSANAG